MEIEVPSYIQQCKNHSIASLIADCYYLILSGFIFKTFAKCNNYIYLLVSVITLGILVFIFNIFHWMGDRYKLKDYKNILNPYGSIIVVICAIIAFLLVVPTDKIIKSFKINLFGNK